jgi:hypothetical protein
MFSALPPITDTSIRIWRRIVQGPSAACGRPPLYGSARADVPPRPPRRRASSHRCHVGPVQSSFAMRRRFAVMVLNVPETTCGGKEEHSAGTQVRDTRLQ